MLTGLTLTSLALTLLPSVVGAATGPDTPVLTRDDGDEISLTKAIRLALENSPVLAAARANVVDAAASRLAAYGALFPTASVTYGYVRATEPQLGPLGQTLTTSAWGTELSATYDPVASLSALAPLQAARAAWTASSAAAEDAEATTTFSVKQAFYRAVASRELIAVEGDRLDRQTKQVEFVAARLEQGRVSRMEVLRSEIDRNNAKVALARARAGFLADTERLGAVVGVGPPLRPASGTGLAKVSLLYGRDEVIALARRSSPRLRSARARTAAAEANVTATRLAYVPKISLTVGWVLQDTSFPPRDASWRAAAVGSYPLFDAFRRSADIEHAEAARASALANERELELRVTSGVIADYDRVVLELEAIQTGELTAQHAREEVLMQEERFRLGRGSILELQTAQAALQQAALDLLRARLDFAVGIARLESWLGKLPTPEE